jgi:hypothetical protein
MSAASTAVSLVHSAADTEEQRWIERFSGTLSRKLKRQLKRSSAALTFDVRHLDKTSVAESPVVLLVTTRDLQPADDVLEWLRRQEEHGSEVLVVECHPPAESFQKHVEDRPRIPMWVSQADGKAQLVEPETSCASFRKGLLQLSDLIERSLLPGIRTVNVARNEPATTSSATPHENDAGDVQKNTPAEKRAQVVYLARGSTDRQSESDWDAVRNELRQRGHRVLTERRLVDRSQLQKWIDGKLQQSDVFVQLLSQSHSGYVYEDPDGDSSGDTHRITFD